MDNNIDLIVARLDAIERKLDALVAALEIDIAPNCQRMGEHITFIENVYSAARAPLAWLSSRIGGDMDYPAIENSMDDA